MNQALNASSFTKKFVKLQQAQKEREDQQYPYSPTGSDDETPETNVPGEPPSILRGPGENTLRKNFQAIQVSKMAILKKILSGLEENLQNLSSKQKVETISSKKLHNICLMLY